MDHADHVRLLEGEPGVRERLGKPIRDAVGIWADLGAGSGAFTLALAELLAPNSSIYAVDLDQAALDRLIVAMRKSFPATLLSPLVADFTQPLNLPVLDGIVMANSLHFVPNPEKPALLSRLRSYLCPGGQFLLVEYDVDQGNTWVPYPLSYVTWEKMAREVGYTKTARLASRPSRFMTAIYAALSFT